MKIPLYSTNTGKAETNAALRVIKSGIFARGEETEKFEKEFSRYIGGKYCIAVANGTCGLHLAVRSLGWKRGDEVITTPYSFIASSNVLLYEGIKPVFVDIDPVTFNIDPREIEKNITKRTKGILLVHVFGLPAECEKLKAITKKYKLDVIEDACEAIGKPSSDFPVGTVGSVCVYSFFENKPITSGGEGGMIVTNNHKIFQYCRSARDQGRSLGKDWLNHVIQGYNYRITEIQAAIGREQLKRLDFLLEKRELIAEKYNAMFMNRKDIKIPYKHPQLRRSWFIYFVQFSDKLTREKAKKTLTDLGIQCHIYFPSIHLFPQFKAFGYKESDFPISEHISNTTLAIPFHPNLKRKHIKFIADTLVM